MMVAVVVVNAFDGARNPPNNKTVTFYYYIVHSTIYREQTNKPLPSVRACLCACVSVYLYGPCACMCACLSARCDHMEALITCEQLEREYRGTNNTISFVVFTGYI